jgi:hypothetical protein
MMMADNLNAIALIVSAIAVMKQKPVALPRPDKIDIYFWQMPVVIPGDENDFAIRAQFGNQLRQRFATGAIVHEVAEQNHAGRFVFA